MLNNDTNLFLNPSSSSSFPSSGSSSSLSSKTESVGKVLKNRGKDRYGPYSRRKISRVGETPSITQTSSKDATLAEKHAGHKPFVVQHAYMRMIFVLLIACAELETAKRSDRKSPTDQPHSCGRAHLQGARAKNPDNACHSNSIAGYKDNWTLRMIKEITETSQMTPNKERIFRVKLQSEDLLKTLKENIGNPDFVYQFIDKNLQKDSLLRGTSLDVKLNATINLPRLLNLECDCMLERATRQKLCDLLKACAEGYKLPEDVCNDYLLITGQHFQAAVKDCQERIYILEEFEIQAKKCLEIEEKYNAGFRISDDELSDYAKSMREISKKLKSLNQSSPWTKLKLKKNWSYFKNRIAIVEQVPSLDPSKIREKLEHLWALRRTNFQDKIKEEFTKTLENYKKLKDYNSWQFEGTQLPDFLQVIGVFNPKTNERVMPNRAERLELRDNLLRKREVTSPDFAVRKRKKKVKDKENIDPNTVKRALGF